MRRTDEVEVMGVAAEDADGISALAAPPPKAKAEADVAHRAAVRAREDTLLLCIMCEYLDGMQLMNARTLARVAGTSNGDRWSVCSPIMVLSRSLTADCNFVAELASAPNVILH